MTATPSVLIADDHAPTRNMVRRSLEQGGFRVAAEAPDAGAAVRACEDTTVDVALLDIRMPGGGLHAATVIGATQPHVALVMLTVSADDSDLFAAVSAGASGYLLKGGDPQEIPDALWRVLSGEAALDGTLTKRILSDYRSRPSHRHLHNRLPAGIHLTQKEWEVLDLLVKELSTAEIAQRLFVADVTVRTHVAAIVRKLGVKDRFEAVRLLRGPSVDSA